MVSGTDGRTRRWVLVVAVGKVPLPLTVSHVFPRRSSRGHLVRRGPHDWLYGLLSWGDRYVVCQIRVYPPALAWPWGPGADGRVEVGG